MKIISNTGDKMKREQFEATYGKLGSDTIYIDMDAEVHPQEVRTGGWTDSQIRNKSLEDIDRMIISSDKVQDKLRESLDAEKERYSNLMDIRARKLIL